MASADTVVRLGLAGCGRIAQLGYVPAIAALGEVEVVAVADPVRERAREIAAACKGGRAHTHESIDSLIEQDLDGIIIATPPDRHLSDASKAAQAGLVSLIEKPPAPDSSSAAALAELSPLPWIGFNRRFQQGRGLLSELPADGELQLDIEINYRRASWKAHGDHGDALLDLGPHLVDLALLLAGSESASVERADIAPMSADLTLSTPRGPARLRAAVDRPYSEAVHVRREDGRTVARRRQGGIAQGVIARITRRQNPLVQSLRYEIEAFANALQGADPGLLADANDGLRTMRIIDQARQLRKARPS